MSAGFLLPGFALLAVAVFLGLGSRDLPARLTVQALTVVSAVAAGTVAVVVGATAVGFLLGPARQADLVEWCRLVPLHHQVGPIEGWGAVAATARRAAARAGGMFAISSAVKTCSVFIRRSITA